MRLRTLRERLRASHQRTRQATDYGAVSFTVGRSGFSKAPQEVFETASESKARGTGKAQEGELYEQIGRLKMDLEWLKKKADQLG